LVRRWRERFEGLKRESEGRAPQIRTQAQGSTSVEESETTGTVQETSKVEEEEEGIRVVFGLVDGFLLYWDEVRLFASLDLSFWILSALRTLWIPFFGELPHQRGCFEGSGLDNGGKTGL
jgi:hypothetical protein